MSLVRHPTPRMDFDAAWDGVESACLVMRRLTLEMQDERPKP